MAFSDRSLVPRRLTCACVGVTEVPGSFLPSGVLKQEDPGSRMAYRRWVGDLGVRLGKKAPPRRVLGGEELGWSMSGTVVDTKRSVKAERGPQIGDGSDSGRRPTPTPSRSRIREGSRRASGRPVPLKLEPPALRREPPRRLSVPTSPLVSASSDALVPTTPIPAAVAAPAGYTAPQPPPPPT